MPTTSVWAITLQGKCYTLTTASQHWEEVNYSGMDFKRVATVQRCAWAIGGDHQLYVYVNSTDVPIRFKEIAFENQRWNPRDGFCTLLLPTDRPQWSSEDGLTARYKDKIKLTTLSWHWEDDWHIEDTLDGVYLGEEGWMYAIDFPATYCSTKSWLSCVRRRKWVRYRRYMARNTWSSIPSIHDDPIVEPFIDVTVGGLDIPGGDGDSLAVWTVTVLGRVMFRSGVTYNCPEGTLWEHVPTYKGGELNQLSVGPTGLVWAVTWNGSALVRLGITRSNLMGVEWAEVDPPNEESKLFQVSVGTNVVWAVSRDGKVWFRKGVCGSQAGTDNDCAKGSGWVEMVGEMSLITVGFNDQVWALGRDDRVIYFRTCVTPIEPSGKVWKPINLPLHTLSAKLQNPRSEFEGSQQRRMLKDVPKGENVCTFDDGDDSTTCEKLETLTRNMNLSHAKCDNMSVIECVPVSGEVRNTDEQICDGEIIRDGSNLIGEEDDNTSQSDIEGLQSNEKNISNSIYVEDKEYYDNSWLECGTSWIWNWISASGCVVDPHCVPNWFTAALTSQGSTTNEPWHKDIMDLLSIRQQREVENFDHLEHAVEKTSWTTTAKAQMFVIQEGRSSQWIECKLELERAGAETGLDSAIFRCTNRYEKIYLDLAHLTCVMCASDRSKPIMAIYTSSQSPKKNPIRIAFFSETEKEDWIALISGAACDLKGVVGTPSNTSIWATLTKGDIFVSDLSTYNSIPKPAEVFWKQFGGHIEIVETCPAGVVWGIGYNYTVWVYSGGWGGGFFKGIDSSLENIFPVTDVRYMYIYENQRWNPLTGFSNRGLPTDRYMWSDKTGIHECTKENMKLPSSRWQWITDWTVDFSTPGGVDKQGWQYARDFPMTYHGYKGFTDYVRRRRWYRKCKFSVMGPWLELDSVSLVDVSMQIDCDNSCPDSLVSLWAVSTKGELIFRKGVTKSHPKGLCWELVATEHHIMSVSIGSHGRLWVVTKNGTALLRQGISEKCVTGNMWISVEAPNKYSPLHQVSVGETTVWAVDVNNGLWFRQEIKSIFPEGTSWKLVCNGVKKVSVGSDKEVCAIIENVGSTSGVVARRTGITEENLCGVDWDYGIGGGWHHISSRACAACNVKNV